MGGDGGAAGLVPLVVWARTGHAINAVAAIMALGVLKPMRARMIERDRSLMSAGAG